MTIKKRLEKLEAINPPREVRVVRLIGNETPEEACSRLGIEDDENTEYTNAWMDLRGTWL
jgi:hypothetical protein